MAGNIPHALFFSTDIARPAQFRYPAVKTDGWSNASVTIPEGSGVQLDPNINLDAIPGITPGELAVGKALQVFGAYCGDNGGSRMGFLFEYPDNGSRTGLRERRACLGLLRHEPSALEPATSAGEVERLLIRADGSAAPR